MYNFLVHEQHVDNIGERIHSSLLFFVLYFEYIFSMSLNDLQSHLTKEQKTGFVLLLLFAITTVGLGFLQLRNTIYSPFTAYFSKNKETTIELQDDATRLQSIDTDRDGLSDYDEMTFYQTSAYLPDTDSDGKTDKQEIDAKSNPLCAEGKPCEDADLPESDSAEQDLIDKAAKTATPLNFTGGAAGSVDAGGLPPAQLQPGVPDMEALLKDPAQLRAYLLATGKISEAQLSQIDDVTLLETFKATYNQQAGAQASTGTTTSTKTSSP